MVAPQQGSVELMIWTGQRTKETVVHYESSKVGARYASGSFILEPGMTQEQAREIALQNAAQYLNLPQHEFIGYESRAPVTATPGQATAARQQEYIESRENIAALHQQRESLRQGFGGPFTNEYRQRMAAAPIGTPIPSQQQYMKIQHLQTGQATFGGEAEFRQVTSPLAQYGAFAGITQFQGRIQPQAPSLQSVVPGPGSQYESPFGKGLIKKENFPGANTSLLPSSRVGRSESEFAYHPKYGQLIPADIAAELSTGRSNVFKEVMPKEIGLSSSSISFFTGAKEISEDIRGFKIDTGKLPKEIRESPGYAGIKTGFQLGRESTARLTEFVGTIPGTTEIFVKTAIKEPGKIPGMLAIGGLEFVGGTAKQARENPAQLLSDIIVSAGVFKGASKGARITKDVAISQKPGILKFMKSESAELLVKKRKPQELKLIEKPKVAEVEKPLEVIDLTKASPLPTSSYMKAVKEKSVLEAPMRPRYVHSYKRPLSQEKLLSELRKVAAGTQTVSKGMIKPVVIPISAYAARAITVQTPISISKAMSAQTQLSIQRQISLQMPVAVQRQKSISAYAFKTLSLQVPRQITPQIYKTVLVPTSKTIQRSSLRFRPPSPTRIMDISIPKLRKPSKTSSVFVKRGKTGKLSFGKFGEISKVASVKQIFGGRRTRRGLI